MKHVHLVLILIMSGLLCACAPQQVKTSTGSAKIPAAKVVSAEEVISAKEDLKTEDSTLDSNIIGKPLSSGKFFRLKIGMTLKQVEKLIGSPNRQWRRSGKKTSTTSHSDMENWGVKYSYAHEGVLTFSSAEEPVLSRILVNRVE